MRLAALLLAFSTSVSAAQTALTARLDSAMRDRRDGGAQASIAVAVMRGHDALLLRAYGLASMTIPYAAGAICSSVADFAEWERLFHGGHVLSPASYTAMMTPGVLTDGTRFPYGFGLTVGTLAGHPAAMHGGEVNGFSSANDQTARPQIICLDLARIAIGVAPTGFGALDRR